MMGTPPSFPFYLCLLNTSPHGGWEREVEVMDVRSFEQGRYLTNLV